MLTLDGNTIHTGHRRFWDLRQPEVVDILTRRVIDQLADAGFGLLKIDHNANTGFGCDGPESPGRNLQRYLDAMRQFVQELQHRMPQLTIENCSSGGQRLDPLMQSMCSVGSSTDCHEGRELPIIGANLQRLIAPRQSLLWATLRPEDDDRRLVYSLAATFLGRMCLSGPVDELSDAQWAVVDKAIELYRHAAGIIRSGLSRRFGNEPTSYRHPTGWQSVRRLSTDGRRALIVTHGFGDVGPNMPTIEVPLPQDDDNSDWRIEDELLGPGAAVRVDRDHLRVELAGPFDATVTLLSRPSLL